MPIDTQEGNQPSDSTNKTLSRREKNRLAQQRHRSRAKELHAAPRADTRSKVGTAPLPRQTSQTSTPISHLGMPSAVDYLATANEAEQQFVLDPDLHGNVQTALSSEMSFNDHLATFPFSGHSTVHPSYPDSNSWVPFLNNTVLQQDVLQFDLPQDTSKNPLSTPQPDVVNSLRSPHRALCTPEDRRSRSSTDTNAQQDSVSATALQRQAASSQRAGSSSRRETLSEPFSKSTSATRVCQKRTSKDESSGHARPSGCRRVPFCAKVDGAIPAGRTTLHMLCESSSSSMISRFINMGAEPEAEDEFGMTPLHIAARRGNESAVAALLDHGVDVDRRDQQGWTPLHHATWCGHNSMTSLLIRRGASMNAATVSEDKSSSSGSD